jgi:hypothetical protein
MEVKVRLGAAENVYVLSDAGCNLYDGLKQVILAIEKEYSYLYI